MTIKEFCEAAKVSRTTVYKMFDNDTLVAYYAPPRKGKYINPADVLYLVTNQPKKLGRLKLGKTTAQKILEEGEYVKKNFIFEE